MAIHYVRSGASGANDGTSKTDAFTTLNAAYSAGAAGDTFYVANDHNQSQASQQTLTSPGTSALPCLVLCVDFAGSTPPVSADLSTGALIQTTGANNIQTGPGPTYWQGVELRAGSGGVSARIDFLHAWGHFKNCKLRKNSTSNSGTAMTFGGSSTNTAYSTILDNTTMEFGHTGDSINIRGPRFVWRNTPNAIQGATLPNILFVNSQNYGANVFLEGVDFSALGSGKKIVGNISAAQHYYLKDCKIDAAVVIADPTITPGGVQVFVSRTDSGGTNYVEQKWSWAGNMVDETVIVRTGGMTDGTTKKSRNITVNSDTKWITAFEAPAVIGWNDVTGASVTATMEFIWNAAALPNNDDIWFDLEYLGDSANPLGFFVSGTKADVLATGSALTASTAAWDSVASARANSTAYTLGQVFKVASNPGRLFFCTTAGTSSGSEPGGYSSAVDGGSVNDGTAVFRAGVRFKQSLSFTPQMKGPIYAYIKAAKPSTTFYADGWLELS